MERNNLGIIVKERPHVRVASKNCLVLQAIADLGNKKQPRLTSEREMAGVLCSLMNRGEPACCTGANGWNPSKKVTDRRRGMVDLGILEVSPDGAQEEACGLGLLSQRAAQLEEALDHCPTKEERRTLCREERHGARPSSP